MPCSRRGPCRFEQESWRSPICGPCVEAYWDNGTEPNWQPADESAALPDLKPTSAPEVAPAPPSAFGKQVGGDHYNKLAIQPFQYSMANKLDPMQHTAIKYVTRFRDKGGKESLLKAIHTIELLIEHEYGTSSEAANPA